MDFKQIIYLKKWWVFGISTLLIFPSFLSANEIDNCKLIKGKQNILIVPKHKQIDAEKINNRVIENLNYYCQQQNAVDRSSDILRSLDEIKSNTKKNWLDILSPALASLFTAFAAIGGSLIMYRSERKKIVEAEYLRWLQELRELYSKYIVAVQMTYVKLHEIKYVITEFASKPSNPSSLAKKDRKMEDIIKEMAAIESERIYFSRKLIIMLVSKTGAQPLIVKAVRKLEGKLNEFTTTDKLETITAPESIIQKIGKIENVLFELMHIIGKETWQSAQGKKVNNDVDTKTNLEAFNTFLEKC